MKKVDVAKMYTVNKDEVAKSSAFKIRFLMKTILKKVLIIQALKVLLYMNLAFF